MTQFLAEGKYGVSKPKPRIHHWWNRLIRKNVVRASVPFSWSMGCSGTPMYDIKNQYESDSCWGQATSRAIQILLSSPDLSAKSAYSQCYSVGGGVWTPDGENQMLHKGLTTEALVPSTVNGDAPEPFMEDTSWLTPTLSKDCFTRAGFQLLSVDINITAIANAIATYKSVIFTVQGQNNGTWLSSTPFPPADKTDLWEHFLCFTGNIPQQVSNYTIPFYNSWGPETGNNAIQNLTQTYINSGYVVDVFAVVPFQFQSGIFLGCVGTKVSMLQEMLRSTGDFAFPYNTSLFGPLTFNAVCSYQKRNNIPETGYVGPLTAASLNTLLGSSVAKK